MGTLTARQKRAIRRVEKFGPKPENEIVREIRQAKSESEAIRVLRDYGYRQWSEGYDEGRRDGEAD